MWNAYIERYHTLGHRPSPGALLRVRRSPDHRRRGLRCERMKNPAARSLHRLDPLSHVDATCPLSNNARFLILSWIRSTNRASRVLALISRRLSDDWQARYAYRPVLLETFVDNPRSTGTCYQAAHWQYLGDTQGCGTVDTLHRRDQPIQTIWIYLLARAFRRHLCNE